jgi:hypothetical protein
MVEPTTGCGNGNSQFRVNISEKIQFLQECIHRGWWIFPLHDLTLPGDVPHCGCHLGTRCPGPGKHPRGKWSEPLNPADCQSKEYVRNVVTQWPERGWGLHCGKSALYILDVDPRHGGKESLAELVRERQIDLGLPTTCTGGGGWHYYFQSSASSCSLKGYRGANGKTSTNIALGAGLEFFSGQHYVVLPYSPHASGGWYTREGSGPVVALPAPLAEHISQMEIFRVKETQPVVSSPSTWLPPSEAARVQPSGPCTPEARAAAWIAKRAPAVSGQAGRKHTAATAAALVVEFNLSVQIAMTLMVIWNATCVPPWEADQLREILEWANGSQAERGRKLQNQYTKAGRTAAELPEWMQGMSMAIHSKDFTWEVLADGTCKGVPVPTLTAITQEEIDLLCAPPATQGTEADLSYDTAWGKVSVVDVHACGERSAGYAEETIVTQRQGAPPAETHYHYEEGPMCECSFQVLLHQARTSSFRVLRLPGRRWDCPACGFRRREHYKATIREHLAKWAEQVGGPQATTLWTAVVPRSLWRRVGSSIRVRGGEFIRMDTEAVGSIPGQTFLAVSTERTSHCEWTAISPAAATLALCSAVDLLPADLQVRTWWSSRGWKLLEDRPKKDPQWDRVGTLRTSITRVLAVLDAWDIQPKAIRGVGRFWSWTGHQAKYPAGAWEDLRSDLSDGDPIQKFRREIGLPPGWDGVGFEDDQDDCFPP